MAIIFIIKGALANIFLSPFQSIIVLKFHQTKSGNPRHDCRGTLRFEKDGRSLASYFSFQFTFVESRLKTLTRQLELYY